MYVTKKEHFQGVAPFESALFYHVRIIECRRTLLELVLLIRD